MTLVNYVIAILVAGMMSAESKSGAVPPGSAIYIEPQNGFETYISAAFFKKHVNATLANDEQGSAFILRSGHFALQEEKSGLGKLARCAYAFCLGIDGSQTVSVQLINTATKQVVWAYSVRKIGTVNYQSSAEAIAKHLKEVVK